ncbi:hypothetical protein [uncultured Pelagimonas sp.]|uniref:hypothetical protein n=1 Tax=uncultured Pelagimonas sp. TaxID=1618102 RepID=UPI00261300E7|nr:hypothetical protein [uncultured Pelagimonas sp.]
MNPEAVKWVLVGFTIFVGVMVWGLTCFWRSWFGLSRYFIEMQNTPLEKLRVLGWIDANPMNIYHSGRLSTVGNGWAFRVLLLRLLIWGHPPAVPHSPAATGALRQFRLWSFFGTLPVLTFLIVIIAAIGISGIWLALPFFIGCLVSLIVASPWPKEIE